MKTIDKKILTLNAEGLKNMLTYFVKQNRHLQELGLKPKAMNIVGERGIGKTSIIRDFAAENNMGFIDLNLSAFEEKGDIIGFPMPEFYMCIDKTIETPITIGGKTINKLEKKQECAWISKDFAHMYETMGYTHSGRSRMSYALPEWFERIEGKENGILLLDDFTRADSSFQQALMSLFLDQSIQTWKLPKGWTVVATSNPSTLDYNVEELDKAQADRFFTFQLDFDVKQWALWADNHHIDTSHIMFMMNHPELIGKDLSARGVSSFFESIIGLQYEESKTLINELGESMCGVAFMGLFNSEMHGRKYDIPNADFIMQQPFSVVSKKLKDCIGEGENYRSDISWLIMNRLKNYCGKGFKPNANHVQQMKNILISNIFNDNQAYYLAKKIILGNDGFVELCSEDEILTMIGK